jgi:hypothetical protein
MDDDEYIIIKKKKPNNKLTPWIFAAIVVIIGFAFIPFLRVLAIIVACLVASVFLYKFFRKHLKSNK